MAEPAAAAPTADAPKPVRKRLLLRRNKVVKKDFVKKEKPKKEPKKEEPKKEEPKDGKQKRRVKKRSETPHKVNEKKAFFRLARSKPKDEMKKLIEERRKTLQEKRKALVAEQEAAKAKFKEERKKAKAEGKRPPNRLIPERVRKQLLRAKRHKLAREKKRLRLAKGEAWRKKEYFVRAEKYVKAYRTEAKQKIRAEKKAKLAGNFYVPAQPRLAVVTRLRGVLGVSPKPRKALQLLRLRQINNTVFVRLNKSTLSLLKIVEPYIAWGYPTLTTVKNLIYKRGFLKVDGKRVPLLDNKQIEKALKGTGLICVEDLIHEIFTTGRNFPKVNRLLWPFKLSNPKGGFSDKGTHFVEGGDAGNREEFINALLKRMI